MSANIDAILRITSGTANSELARMRNKGFLLKNAEYASEARLMILLMVKNGQRENDRMAQTLAGEGQLGFFSEIKETLAN
jgi:hypothetical protein